MADGGVGWWRKLLPGGFWKDGRGALVELEIDRPTVGLCFDFARDCRFESVSLSDAGLERILTILARLEVRATFNIAAKLCEIAPDQVHMIAECGHEIGAYGYTNEKVRDLDDDQLKGMLYSCRDAFAQRRLQPIGFRVYPGECDPRLYRELSLHRFLYVSEHDHSKRPHVIHEGKPSLVRVPVCTDDRGYIRHAKRASTVLSKHHRYLRKAAKNGHFVSISFHPWILEEERHRMADFEEWLESAVRFGATIGALEDALPARYRTFRVSDDAED